MSKPGTARSARWLGLAILALTTTSQAELKIGTLQVGTEIYQDVAVTEKTPDSIFITHSRGFANVKVTDLGPELLAKLGYDAKSVKLNSGQPLALEDLPLDPKVLAMKDELTARFQEQWQGRGPVILTITCGLLLVGYLLFSYCSQLICQKVGNRPGIAVWIPVIQFLPLLQAANMSVAWFLLAVLPLATPLFAVPMLKAVGPAASWMLLLPFLIPVFIYLIWSVKICRARAVGQWAALLLILPLTSFIAYLYLAFSPAGVRSRAEKKPTLSVRHTGSAQDTAFFLQS